MEKLLKKTSWGNRGRIYLNRRPHRKGGWSYHVHATVGDHDTRPHKNLNFHCRSYNDALDLFKRLQMAAIRIT
jgi:hypothetical protein